MSPLPWLPSGENELPASRFVLFANTSHMVQKMDESAITLNGTSFTGIWESGSLNKGEIVEKTLRYLTITYISRVNTTVRVRASGNGGDTWINKTVSLEASSGEEIQRAQVRFGVTGYDLRIRLELIEDALFHIYELHPVIARRGEYVG